MRPTPARRAPGVGPTRPRRAAEGRAVFKTTQRLAPNEGLTIVVGWPKGYVAEPSSRERAAYFLKDNRGLLAAAIGVVVVLAYYLLVWLAVGKDPEKGVIVPLYTPPAASRPRSCASWPRWATTTGSSQPP